MRWPSLETPFNHFEIRWTRIVFPGEREKGSLRKILFGGCPNGGEQSFPPSSQGSECGRGVCRSHGIFSLPRVDVFSHRSATGRGQPVKSICEPLLGFPDDLDPVRGGGQQHRPGNLPGGWVGAIGEGGEGGP
jgi:hypothetical protein